ncbi:MAG: hypothetical protein LAT84_09285 [Balneolia bacterium]|nr:hypothetical protein [Balneolia bacterium]
MKAHTYGKYVIHQKGRYPKPGDVVENAKDAEITINGINGNRRKFEVRDGVIKREMKGPSGANIIVGVLFVFMMALTLYFFALWMGYR